MANSIDLLVILLACVSQGSSLLFSKNQKLVSIVRKNFRQQQKHTKLYLNQFVNADYSSLPESSQNSQLPDSFQDAVQRAAVLSLKCFDSGIKYCRIDFDTTVGDMTYTSLKNSMPLVKELTTILANKLDLVTSISAPTNVDNNTTTPVDIQKDFYDEINNADGRGTIRLFFPDMGAAVLARRDWKMGTPVAEVPSCIRTANIQNDPILVHDKVAIILCPLYSETDSVKRVLDLCVANGTPCIMINPELINMDQGFGVRARLIRNNILNIFTTSYKLKTLPEGALVREWPAGYSVWFEDEAEADGYRLLRSFESDPPREAVNMLLEEAKPAALRKTDEPNIASNLVFGVTTFFKGLSRL